MGYSSAISIGPEFFAKAKNDYSNFEWALIREFLQNSIDAKGSKSITITIEDHEDVTRLAIINDGEPMTKEILTDKLLSLGGSGKEFRDTVGGFGKAKEILYFCHRSYEIKTGPYLVQGSGAGYDLTEGEPFDGTCSVIVLTDNRTQKLISVTKAFAAMAQWHGTITLNGETLVSDLRKGSPRREFEWGTVYTNKTFENRLIVRIGGIPMFTYWIDMKRTVVLELKGLSSEVLTSNRDGLLYGPRNELHDFIADIATNRSKALKAASPTYKDYGGNKLHASKENPEHKEVVASVSNLVALVEPEQARERVGLRGVGISTIQSVLDERFILKNETTLAIPEYYCPDSDKFSGHAKKLVRMWARILLKMHELFECDKPFGVGFVFSEDADAQCEQSTQFGLIYYLNPAVIVEQKGSASKSLKKRFSLTDRDRLLAIAAHEVVHALGFSSHNEEFATKLTDLLWKVMKHRKSFNWCFK